MIPLTGRYAPGGAQIKNGYELAVEDLNAAGGVDLGGRKIPLDLIVLDDESDASKTVQNLETLYAQEGVVAYLGGFGSDLHAAAAGIAEKNQVALSRRGLCLVFDSSAGFQVPVLAVPQVAGGGTLDLRYSGYAGPQADPGRHLRGEDGLGRGTRPDCGKRRRMQGATQPPSMNMRPEAPISLP